MALTPLFLTGYEHGFSGTVANMILGGGLAATGKWRGHGHDRLGA